MKRAYKYTILTVLLAVMFSLGIMEGMNFILRARERFLLAEKGNAQEEMPIQEWEGREVNLDFGDTKTHDLTMEQAEDAVKRWNGKIAMKVHKPAEGQISMEEAIQVGEGWIAEMGPEDWGLAEERRSVCATLGVSVRAGEEEGEVPLEPDYSFWTVELNSKSLRAFLYVNAVAGRVWNANVYLYEVPMEESRAVEKLRKFVELTGMKGVEGDGVALERDMMEYERRMVYLGGSLDIAGSRMCAGLTWISNMATPYTEHGEKGLKELRIGLWLDFR